MSDCSEARTNQWLERYVEGSLPEPEAQKFEDHYFDCPACVADLDALQAARIQLRRHPVVIAPPRRILGWPVIAGAFAAIAATFLIATFNGRIVDLVQHRSGPPIAVIQKAPQNTPAPPGPPATANQEIAQLADLQLPPYHARVLRGEQEDPAFAEGMRLYSAGDCSGAIDALAKVPAAGSLAPQFYTGVCQIHLGDLTGAARTLRSVAGAGDSPQQEAAIYYLAQISLAHNDAGAARKNLERVLALHGDLEQQAQKQLAALRADPRRK